MDEEQIIGFEALWDSMMKCKRGVIWKDSVAGFVLNAIPNVVQLEKDLKDGTYKERAHKYFTITSPKRRDIMSISFRDRVYQRSLNDVGIYPAMAKGFIYDNCACQKGKGTDFARERLKCHLQRYWRKHGMDGWVLKIDVKGYYPNMRHDVAKNIFARRLEPFVYDRAAVILDSFPGETGFNPGSQIIQIAGISMLDSLDHYIKERLRVRQYIRYMDDMILILPTKDEAETVLEDVKRRLAEIGFETHPDKTTISPLKDGMRFLGFDFRLTETGKVIQTIDPDRVKAQRRKLKRLVEKSKRGEISRAKVDESYRSWRNHASKGDNYGLIRRMDNYYVGLWEGGGAGAQDHQENGSACHGGRTEPDEGGAG